MDIVLSFKNLSVGYYGKEVLGGLNEDLLKGEVLHIQGSNGKGKTTLLKTIMKEITPVKGEINRFFKRPYYLKQSYQDKIHLPLTVKEILGHSCHKLSFSSELQWNNLSGGQKQQVLIHKAFSADYDLIIMDEPLNHLDEKSREEVINLLRLEKKRREDLPLIIVSHIPFELDMPIKRLKL